MADPEFVEFNIRIAYDRTKVSDRVHEAIGAIMRRVGREVQSKGALLANPDIMELDVTEWDALKGETVPMNLEDLT